MDPSTHLERSTNHQGAPEDFLRLKLSWWQLNKTWKPKMSQTSIVQSRTQSCLLHKLCFAKICFKAIFFHSLASACKSQLKEIWASCLHCNNYNLDPLTSMISSFLSYFFSFSSFFFFSFSSSFFSSCLQIAITTILILTPA